MIITIIIPIIIIIIIIIAIIIIIIMINSQLQTGYFFFGSTTETEYAHTGEIVKRAFQDNYKKSIKLSGSQVTIHKIYNENTNEATIEKWVVKISKFSHL